ncbi:MAG: MBL fold metallo-hydrolase [Anaerolineales bacterium]|nr:MBL fold metallo-hydrolase [Chloroflexota bacterium]MBL6982204.1 MBL fold metallo-hydrolase [Anaerolineales bacterium]
MKITWHGHSCFRLSSRGLATVVTDPYDEKVVGYGPLNLRGQLISISQDSPAYNNVGAVKPNQRVINGPGEYEIGSVFITAVRTNGGKRKEDELRNTLYVFDYEGVSVAHLGNLDRVPSQSQVEALGTVNVALVPVGGGVGLNAAKAAEVISLLEPGIVVPMHYGTPKCKIKLDPLSKFLKEMGLGTVQPLEELSVTTSSVPTETQVVVLDYQA